MAEIRILHSLYETSREEWNACFAGELEDYDYLLAVEESGMEGFVWRYAAAFENGMLIAAMPAFLTDYALDTTLEGFAKKITSKIRTLLPRLLTLKLACLGSPNTETGRMGFHPSVGETEKPTLLAALLEAFEAGAVREGYRLTGLKDIPHEDRTLWESVITCRGYKGMAGLPVAHMPVGFASMDAYFTTLSAATRKDMRRKLRARAEVRIEERSNIDDVLPLVIKLYQETRGRAQMQFENLTGRFFEQVLRSMPGRAFCTLYFVGGTLLAINLLLRNECVLLDKFFCMEAEPGRAHNLYFISWMHNIEYCIKHGLTHYQSGQAGYQSKLRLGSRLASTRMYFRHANPVIQGMLVLVAPFLAAGDEPGEAV